MTPAPGWCAALHSIVFADALAGRPVLRRSGNRSGELAPWFDSATASILHGLWVPLPVLAKRLQDGHPGFADAPASRRCLAVIAVDPIPDADAVFRRIAQSGILDLESHDEARSFFERMLVDAALALYGPHASCIARHDRGTRTTWSLQILPGTTRDGRPLPPTGLVEFRHALNNRLHPAGLVPRVRMPRGDGKPAPSARSGR